MYFPIARNAQSVCARSLVVVGLCFAGAIGNLLNIDAVRAQQAQLEVSDAVVTGIKGLVINGDVYDGTFHKGPFNSLTMKTLDWQFALDASNALSRFFRNAGDQPLVQRLLARQINARGCGDVIACYISTPYRANYQTVYYAAVDMFGFRRLLLEVKRRKSDSASEDYRHISWVDWTNVRLRDKIQSSPESPTNALVLAALEGRVDAVDLWIRGRAYMDAKDWEGRTALFAAAEGGHYNVLSLLVRAGAEVDLKSTGDNWEDATALIAAAAVGNHRMVELLIKAGADVTLQSEYGTTAFLEAAGGGHLNEVLMFIDEKPEVFANAGQYSEAIVAAARGGHLGVVKEMGFLGVYVNSASEALIHAVRFEHTELVRFLVQTSTNVNAMLPIYGIMGIRQQTALILAAGSGDVEIVDLLIKAGADVNAVLPDGTNAYSVAYLMKHQDVVNQLVAAGATGFPKN